MLVNLREILRVAEEKNAAVGSFNVCNVESLQAVLAAAEAASTPVIISFGESYDKHMPLEAMAELVKYYAAHTDLPLVLHLDHCKHDKNIWRALRAGFTSVMFDGSALPLEENIAASHTVSQVVHDLNVSLEGELGYMNPEDGSAGSPGGPETYTTVDAARRYAAESGADALAIAIGNAHGLYKGEPHLDLDRLSEIHRAVRIPLVLHGSSDIPLELLQQAIKRGIRKININTEVSTTGIRAAREFLAAHTDPNTRFENMTKDAEQKMSEVVSKYIACFSGAQ